MDDSYNIRISWQPRSEPLIEEAARYLRMIEGFGGCKPAFDRWFESCWSRREQSIPLTTMPPQVGPLIRRLEIEQRDMHDPDRSNGRRQISAYNFALGSRIYLFVETQNPFGSSLKLPESAEVKLPSQTEFERKLVTTNFVKAILLALKEAWQPVIGRVDAPGLFNHWRQIAGKVDLPALRAGWMTYLAAPLANLIDPPSSAIVEPMPEGGMLISATTERFDVESPTRRRL